MALDSQEAPLPCRKFSRRRGSFEIQWGRGGRDPLSPLYRSVVRSQKNTSPRIRIPITESGYLSLNAPPISKGRERRNSLAYFGARGRNSVIDNPLIGFENENFEMLKSKCWGLPAGYEYVGPRIRILVKNCVYSRLDTSGNPQFGQTVSKSSFGTKKNNLISGLYTLKVNSR